MASILNFSRLVEMLHSCHCMQFCALPGTQASSQLIGRGALLSLFQSVGMMAAFQAEHKTACNDTSAAFPPALRSSAWMPQIPVASPRFNRFTAARFHKRRWTIVDWRVSNRDCNTLDVQLDSWWIRLVQPLKVTGPAGLHFRLLCQEPTTLCSNCSAPRDGLR